MEQRIKESWITADCSKVSRPCDIQLSFRWIRSRKSLHSNRFSSLKEAGLPELQSPSIRAASLGDHPRPLSVLANSLIRLTYGPCQAVNNFPLQSRPENDITVRAQLPRARSSQRPTPHARQRRDSAMIFGRERRTFSSVRPVATSAKLWHQLQTCHRPRVYYGFFPSPPPGCDRPHRPIGASY